MFGELQKFPEHNMTNQRSHLTHKKRTGINSFWSEVIFEAKSLKNDFAPKEFFQSTLLPQSSKQSDLSVMGIFRDFRSYQNL
jgi:hypothetical protein